MSSAVESLLRLLLLISTYHWVKDWRRRDEDVGRVRCGNGTTTIESLFEFSTWAHSEQWVPTPRSAKPSSMLQYSAAARLKKHKWMSLHKHCHPDDFPSWNSRFRSDFIQLRSLCPPENLRWSRQMAICLAKAGILCMKGGIRSAQ